MKDRNHTIRSILFLFFLSALLMARQLVSTGYFSCFVDDTFTYTSWAWQFIEALKEGIIYPRWTHLNFWGYGSPTFILYSPFAFYLVALFNVFTDSIIAAMNITKFIALFLTATGIFFFVKEFYSEKIALLSSSFYISFPFNILNIYIGGAFAATISLMWFSPILLFTYRYFKDRKHKHIIYAGVCYGGLILTHLINAYMLTFIVVAFIIYISIAKNTPKDLIVIPFIIAIGTLISAAYILPFIYEKQFINLKAFTGEGGGFHFANYFILPNLTGKSRPDSFWPVFYSTFVFYVLFFFGFLMLSFLQILKLNHIKTMKDENSINKFFLGIAIFSLFLLFGPSTFLWVNIPFFRYIQFPVRWLNITAFAVVFLSAAGFHVLDVVHKTKRKRYFLIALLFLACLLLDYKYINSAHIFEEQELIPVKAANLNMEHLPAGVDIKKIDKNSEERIVITRGEGKAEIVAWKSAERIIEITAQHPLTLRIRTFNFPGWKAYIDDVQTEMKTEEGVGAMLIDIPAGKHTILLKFVDTPIRYYSKIISLVSFLLMIFLSLFSKKTYKV